MTRSTARKRSKARRWTEIILLLAGIAGLGAWVGVDVASTLWQYWADWTFEAEVSKGGIRQRTPIAQVPSEGSIIGRLTIPRLNLSAMVREGDRESTLSLALGHVPNTALPGERGNVGIAGHRDTIFRSLRGIHKSDLIRLETVSSGSHLYQVISMNIVEPTDVSVLRSGRESELTLVTCYPFNYVGPAPERFIVKAREVDRTPPGSRGQEISFRKAQ
jgi:LPXTG-site transpeptidase (sortase) family protein